MTVDRLAEAIRSAHSSGCTIDRPEDAAAAIRAALSDGTLTPDDLGMEQERCTFTRHCEFHGWVVKR